MTSSRDNNLNMGMKCIKYFLIVINALFLLTSILLITVGRTIQTIYGDFSHFIWDRVMTIPVLLIVVGAIMLIVAIFGILGAFKESTLLTNIYGLLLLFVFVMEITAAIYATVMQGQIRDMLITNMEWSLKSYTDTNNPQAASAIDFMQTNLECCGVTNLKDWENILPLPEGVDNGTIIVPHSCCASTNDYDACEEYIMEGCLNRMEFIVTQSAMIIATGATTVAFVQILGVISAFMLAKSIRRTKSLREARRWQLQQSLGIVANSRMEKPSYDDYKQLEKSAISNEPVTYSYNERA